MKRKVCVVVTARPSYSRIKTALWAIDKHPELELQTVVAASALLDRYGRVESEIIRDGFEVSARVYMVLEGENPTSMAKTTGLGIIELASVFNILQPSVVVTIADRFETMSTAIAASYMGIPLAHVQGGEVTGSIDERVRHSITKLADLHLACTELAGNRIARMGERKSSIYVTGCPSVDLAKAVLDRKQNEISFEPCEAFNGVGPYVSAAQSYIVVMQHPVTTEYSESAQHVKEVLSGVLKAGIPAFWFWPNVDAGSDGTSGGIRQFRELNPNAPIHFFKNLPPESFLELLIHAKAIVGNSSVAIRECSYLGVPAVNVGSRQSGRERGRNVLDVGYDHVEIANAVLSQATESRDISDRLYGDGEAGVEIAAALASFNFESDKKLSFEEVL